MKNVEEWLASLGLGEYARTFADNAIDLSVLPDLTEDDLKELGIPLGHRRKLQRAIAEFDRTPAGRAPRAATVAPQDEAERRQVTVMFCDMVGSMALSARLDPEDMREVYLAFQAAIAEVVVRHDGMVARYMGDGVLAYFGFPQAHEDDAEQAVRAGLAIVDAVAGLKTKVNQALRVRVGIATGTVVVGDLLTGDSGSQEQAVVGDTPNIAARLQSLAEPNAVMICASTRRLVGGLFEYRDFGAIPVKGLSEPIPVWEVLGKSDVKSRFEAQHAARLIEPLGRDEEIDLLLRRWQLAARSEGRVVVLTGEPGIGKSHIALTLQDRLKAEPHVKLSFFCSAHHANSALFPLIAQLEGAARFVRGDTPAQKYAKLETLLGGSGALPDDAVALLAELLSLPPDPRHPLPDLTPQKRKQATLAVFAALLDNLTARKPVLMIFEDVHWIDPTSLELLAQTVERVPRLRMLLLMTARPEFTPPWPGHAHVTTMPLTRLGRRDGAALVERVAGGRALPEEVLTQILARTDGVPLFVEELTKTVLESGILQERQDRYVLDGPLPSLAIPTTLQASLMARLDRLAPVREVAQIGAVIGREFSYELLHVASALPADRLADALNELVRSELVFQRGEIPQSLYTFKHALVRDAAYSGLLKSRRAQLHAALVNAFEQRFPDVAEAEPEVLAHHCMEAGLLGRAADYWFAAGRSAALRSANLEAIANLQRGVDAVRRIPEGVDRHRKELNLLFALGPCMIATKGPASGDAVATFARARELCERLGDPPEYLQVTFWLVTACVIRGELPKAEEMISHLLRLAAGRDDRPALLNAMRGQAMILLFMGRIVEAHAAIERAIAAFDSCGETERLAARAAGQDAGVANLALMSWTLWLRGHVDAAVARIDAALARADAIAHPHSMAYACYYASVLHALRAEPAIAIGHADRCLALSEQHGFRQWRGLSRAVRGTCATMLQPSAEALKDVMAAMDEYRGAGYQLGITALHALLSRALLQLGQPEPALEMIEQGLSTATHNSERLFEAELHRLKARALLGRDAADGAVQPLLEQALATARAQQARALELRAASDLAELCAREGRPEVGRDLLAPVLAWFKEGAGTQDHGHAEALLARLVPPI